MLRLDKANKHAKLDHCNFSHSRDMVGVPQNLNGSHDMTTPFSGIVCHPWASTCYVNLSTKFEVSLSLSTTKIQKAMQNSENGVVWGNQWSLQVTGNSAIQYSKYEFLLVLHSNYVPMLHRFWDITRCWSKNRQFEPTHLYLASP